MSDLYRRKPTTVPAWRFNPLTDQKEWPTWLSSYTASTLMGPQSPGRGAGVLLIPTKLGETINVPPGDWVVLEEGVIIRVKDQDFARLFEKIEDAPAETAPEVVAEPEPPAAPEA